LAVAADNDSAVTPDGEYGGRVEINRHGSSWCYLGNQYSYMGVHDTEIKYASSTNAAGAAVMKPIERKIKSSIKTNSYKI
jgi:hypothetical protein